MKDKNLNKNRAVGNTENSPQITVHPPQHSPTRGHATEQPGVQGLSPPVSSLREDSAESGSSSPLLNAVPKRRRSPHTLQAHPRTRSPATRRDNASDRSTSSLPNEAVPSQNVSPPGGTAGGASGSVPHRSGKGKGGLADTTVRPVVEARRMSQSTSRKTASSSTPRRTTATFDLDIFIDELLSLRSKPVGTQMNFMIHHFPILCSAARSCFASQPCHLELDAPVKVCGDIHGQYFDLLRVFHHGGYPPDANYLFLGDYVDRGQQSLETISLLLAFKIKYPENFFLLRGNHETANISKIYGFFDECKRRFNPKVWQTFIDVFKYLPFTARVNDRILCMHGGISPELQTIAQLTYFQRPCEIPDRGLLCDILWSDPLANTQGWLPNDRGVSYTFGPDVVLSFCRKNEIDLLCRAHQVVEDGFEFFAKRKLVTVFSAPNYCQEFNNAAAFLDISETLECNFVVWKAFGFKGLGAIKEKYSEWGKMRRR
eukprot:GEMP01018088.1.p1 GENE.GEMP01018088.1~~GEMP01018088.1.p1  ORF type:complete len:486 (+),score=76.96 GEMP01018088.1:375-1832(+)